jgi:hypothetical protein
MTDIETQPIDPEIQKEISLIIQKARDIEEMNEIQSGLNSARMLGWIMIGTTIFWIVICLWLIFK